MPLTLIMGMSFIHICRISNNPVKTYSLRQAGVPIRTIKHCLDKISKQRPDYGYSFYSLFNLRPFLLKLPKSYWLFFLF